MDSNTPEKTYSLRRHTASARLRRQALQGFDYNLNRADQADRKARYDTLRRVKKTSEW